MLQQILEKMHIDPELLEELSEDQKQVLFYKMRQEQIRRWKTFEEKMDEEEKKKKSKTTKTNKKKVDFLKGRDGCEWVWVMGEHPSDKSIEQILEEEARDTARKMAEVEAKALREKEEMQLHRKAEEERQRIIKENEEREAELKRQQEEAALYQSIREARLTMERLAIEKKRLEEEDKKRISEIELRRTLPQEKKEPVVPSSPIIPQENKEPVVSSSPILNSPFLSEREKKARRRSQEMSESMKEKRSSEIYSTLQKKRQDMEKLAEEGRVEVETSWKEQEKKAKEAELQMREMARKARTEYKESMRRSFTLMQAAGAFAGGAGGSGNKPPLPPKKHLMDTSAPGLASKKPRPLRPKNHAMIVSWFQKEERDRAQVMDPASGKVANWFHGILNRAETEKILEGKEGGSFLIRVSERVWGYTLSFKEASRFKHFLIDASDLGYQFFGADQTVHESLANLVKFHKDNPITISGQEKLLHPCGQIVQPPDYAELFQDSSKNTSSS